MAYRRRFRSRRASAPRSRRRRTTRSNRRKRYLSTPTRFAAKQGSKVGIPNQILIKFRNVRTLGNVAWAGAETTFSLTATSLANLETTYLQPLRGMYSRYLVCANKVTVYWTPEADSPPSFLTVQAVTGAGDDTPVSYEQAMMQSAARTVRLPIEGAYAGSRPVLRMYRKSKHVFAVKDLVDNRDYSSVTEPANSGPTTQWVWAFTFGSVDGVTNIAGQITIVRDFYTKLYQRKDYFPS